MILPSVKRIILTTLFIIATNILPYTLIGQTLNEKWIYKIEGKECLDIEFLPDSTVRHNGSHTNKWYSAGIGWYHFNTLTNEIFITIHTGGFDWPSGTMKNSNLPIYHGEIFFDYQLYFRIKERTDSSVIVDEYINSYREEVEGSGSFYEKDSVWIEKDGNFTFVGNKPERMKQITYRFTKK